MGRVIVWYLLSTSATLSSAKSTSKLKVMNWNEVDMTGNLKQTIQLTLSPIFIILENCTFL